MTIELQITNLNDSVPFYNRMFGSRPERMDFVNAAYKFRGIDLLLVESETVNSSVNTVLLETEKQLFDLYERLRLDLNKGSMSSCEMLSDTIQVQDKDANTWIFTTRQAPDTSQVTPASKCYLEPFFN